MRSELAAHDPGRVWKRNNQFNSINPAFRSARAAWPWRRSWSRRSRASSARPIRCGPGPDRFRPLQGSNGSTSITVAPFRPGTTSGQLVPVTNYLMSFGDNYAILPLSPTPGKPPPGPSLRLASTASGEPTMPVGPCVGSRTIRPAVSPRWPRSRMEPATTIFVGEGLPDEDANNDFYSFTGPRPGPPSRSTSEDERTRLGLRRRLGIDQLEAAGSANAARGFKSRHPGERTSSSRMARSTSQSSI